MSLPDLDELFNTNPTPFENYVYTNEEKSSGTVAYTQRLTEEHNTVMVMFVYEQKDSIASEGSVVTREYDQLGRLIKETDPLNKDVYIDYDKVGNITEKRDKKGQITSFSYDDRNRLLNQNAGNIAINYTYDKAGNIKTMEDETGLTSYTYYENGRLKRQTEPDGKYIEYDYDKSGNMTQITDYFGKVTDYEYDDRNRLRTVTIDGETTTYSYYSDGARENILYPGAIGTEYIYDGLNNLITLRNVEFSGVINEFSYTYDGVGNQLTRVDANGTTSYTYDNLNRLETVSEPDGSQTTYTFDDNGNIATKDMVHPEDYSFTFKQGGQDKVMNGITSHTINYTNDDSNKLTEITETLDNTGAVSSPYVGPATITVDLDYDENGNLTTTTKGGSADTEISSYKYKQMNQMTEYKSPSSVITSYSYDGNGLRKTKTTGSNTTGFYYSGGNVINEAENGVLKSRNIRGINIIAREDNGGTKAYYLYNGHGDTVNLVTNTGEILNTYDYDAYGKAKLEEESTDNPYRYAGEYYDKESELYYLRARYYDPNIARFISEDSYKGDVNYPLSLNLYTYSWNNPIKYIDPIGNDPYRQKHMNEAQKDANESWTEYAEKTDKFLKWAISDSYKEDAALVFAQLEIMGSLNSLKLNKAQKTSGKTAEIVEETIDLTRQSVDDKLARYLLNMDHPVGGSKAKWFKKALGFTQDNMDDLAKQIVFNSKKAVQTGITEYGTKYNQTISINGANGKVIDVTFAWMKSVKDDVVRLVTAIPTKK
ncbi:RHS repeat protein [Wukongibacter sp. M2B1]|uniref:RHS repeat protein n=1 Tax=Wukongibacter sp. M2B1 TaxID=3088895 RepID=UPI003D7BB2C8